MEVEEEGQREEGEDRRELSMEEADEERDQREEVEDR